MRYGSFRPWENEKGKFYPFNFDPNFSSWAASATSTFLPDGYFLLPDFKSRGHPTSDLKNV